MPPILAPSFKGAEKNEMGQIFYHILLTKFEIFSYTVTFMYFECDRGFKIFLASISSKSNPCGLGFILMGVLGFVVTFFIGSDC